MEDLNCNIPVNYYIDTGWYKTIKGVLSKLNFEELKYYLHEDEKDRNLKEEVDDLIDAAKSVLTPVSQASRNGIRVYKNKNKGWRIEITI